MDWILWKDHWNMYCIISFYPPCVDCLVINFFNILCVQTIIIIVFSAYQIVAERSNNESWYTGRWQGVRTGHLTDKLYFQDKVDCCHINFVSLSIFGSCNFQSKYCVCTLHMKKHWQGWCDHFDDDDIWAMNMLSPMWSMEVFDQWYNQDARRFFKSHNNQSI